MPCDGTPDAGAWNRPQVYDQETTTPYYYSTRFDDSLIRTEFTPTARCGYFRFTLSLRKSRRVAGQPFSGRTEFQRQQCRIRRGTLQQHAGVRLWRIQRVRAGAIQRKRKETFGHFRQPVKRRLWNFATAFRSSASNRRGRICRKKFPTGRLTKSKPPPKSAGMKFSAKFRSKAERPHSAGFFTLRFIVATSA